MSVPTVFQEPGRKSPDELEAVTPNFELEATVLVVKDAAKDTKKDA
jgi:hypothetical protein